MTDVKDLNEFIEKVGDDISATYVPTVQTFIHSVGEQVAASAGPRVNKFVDELVKDIFEQQGERIQDFLTKLVQDLASRYHPEVTGNLTTRVVDRGIEIVSSDTKLVLKKRETGDEVASLKIPVSVKINLEDFSVTLDQATVQIHG